MQRLGRSIIPVLLGAWLGVLLGSLLGVSPQKVLAEPLWPPEPDMHGLGSSNGTAFYTTTVVIPTYPYTSYLRMETNPTYNMPYPVLDWSRYNVESLVAAPVSYTLLVLENAYLKVTFLPELGGRIYQMIYKATGNNELYENPVIKPTAWGPPEQGWWLAVGGVEWALPVDEHGYEWGVPWRWEVLTSTEGVTITVRDTVAVDRLRARVDFFLPFDRAYLVVCPHVENLTEQDLDYKFWLNAMLTPGAGNKLSSGLEFVFNADEMSVHSTGDDRLPGAHQTITGPDYRISWPIYNGINYAKLENWDKWLGFFEYPEAAGDFMGVYDRDAGEGVVRVFPSDIARGAKGFGMGWQHPLASSLWTDDDSTYVELHGGVAPTFWDQAHLSPGEAVSWTEYWYPLGGIGAPSAVTQEGAVAIRFEDALLHVGVHPTQSWDAGKSSVYLWDRQTCAEMGTYILPYVSPLQPYDLVVDAAGYTADRLAMAYLDDKGRSLVDLNPQNCEPAPPLPEPHLGYGVNVRRPARIDSLFAPLGFDWVKLWEEYDAFPTERLPYEVLFILHCPPYINDLNAWGDHVEEVARAGQGLIEAYEICNEPNARPFWNNQTPDPVLFAEMLRIASERINQVDPGAIVISGGLAPVGRIPGTCNGWTNHNCDAMDERTYLHAMLDHGVGDYIDAFGYHPYGFAYPPEQDPYSVSNGFTFRGAEVMHQILVDRGFAHVLVWATEFNWLRDPAEDGRAWCNQDPNFSTYFNWMKVSSEVQADYLVRAFDYADRHWPWMAGMFVWNLDWHDAFKDGVLSTHFGLFALQSPITVRNIPCEASHFFSLRKDDGTLLGVTTAAYDALAAMEKRTALFMVPKLQVQPLQRSFLVSLENRGVLTTSISVFNAGYGVLTWTAQVDPQATLVPHLLVTQGVQDGVVPLTVDATHLEPGRYTGIVTISAAISDTLNSPQQVQIKVQVFPKLSAVFLPLILRGSVVLDPIPVVPTPSGDSQGPSKLGIHALAPVSTVPFVRDVTAGGGCVALVKGVCDFGYLQEVKQVSPETITIGRWADKWWERIDVFGDPAQRAEAYMAFHMAKWEQHHDYVDYWEILNEVDPETIEGHAWLAEFFIAAMDIAEENGYHLALFSYSMGVPEWYEWQAIVETGVFARAKAGGHILSLHEYNAPRMNSRWGEAVPRYPGQDPSDPSLPRYSDRGVLTGRYRHLYEDFLIPRDEVVPLAITECNLIVEHLGGSLPDYFVEDIAWYDHILREDDYVVGMAIFTLGSNGWEDYDYEAVLPALRDHILSLKDE